MKATNFVAAVLFILVIPSAFSSLLDYNVSEFTQPFPLQVLKKHDYRFELVQNWQISACMSSPCVIDPDEIFTIHGFWLVLPDGSPVTDCDTTDQPFDSSKNSDLNLKLNGELERLWPSLYTPDVYEFWEDEWNIYGSCTSFDQYFYFWSGYHLRTAFDFLDYLENEGKSPILPGDYALVDDIIEAIEAGLSKAFGREVHNAVQIQCEEAEGEYVLNQVFLCLDSSGPAECPTRTMCEGTPLIPKKSSPPDAPPPPSWSRPPPPPPRRSPPPPPLRSPPPPPRRSPPPPPRRSPPPPPPRRSPPPPPRRSPPPPPRRSPPPPPRRSPPPPPRRSPPPPPRRSPPPPPRRSPPPPRRPPSPRRPFFAGMAATINSSLLQAY